MKRVLRAMSSVLFQSDAGRQRGRPSAGRAGLVGAPVETRAAIIKRTLPHLP